MKERELFLAALEIEDPATRQARLKVACADDGELLARVESLLSSHEGQSQFLNTPVIEQIADGSEAEAAATILFGNGSTRDDDPDATTAFHSSGPANMTEHDDDSDNEIPLGYLEPSTKPGSVGRLGHYEVLEVIGRGAFGTVLRAFDEKLHRVVAIKVMATEMASTSPARKRFLREAQASAAIRHEHVVSVYAVEEKPLPYLVMEFIPGQTLQQRLDQAGPLDVPTVLRIGRQIAEGLAGAHAQDLIHRDIKPANILLETSVHDRVKITDFGLARAADDASLTQSGMIAGTPMYMAPEQAMGNKLDQRADLFSFGSVLYQMVSGRPPFRANGTLAVLKRLAEDTPRPIREIILETPQWLCDIITKLHAKNPDQRYQSAREIADVLANCEAQLKEHAGLKDLSRIPQAKGQSAGWWKWVAASMLIAPLLVFGLYAITRPEAHLEVTKKETTPSSAITSSKGWVSLFNARTSGGWAVHQGTWNVTNGILESQTAGEIVTERKISTNFHLRLFARLKYGVGTVRLHSPDHQLCWVVRLEAVEESGFVDGHLTAEKNEPTGDSGSRLAKIDEWFRLEIMTRENSVEVIADGKSVMSLESSRFAPPDGHIGLSLLADGHHIAFRDIEFKVLPPTQPPTPSSGWHGWSADAPPPVIAPFDAAQAKKHQEAWAKHLGVPVEYTNSIGMKFVLIPPGEFLMGSKAAEIKAALKVAYPTATHWHECIKSEAPQHKVILTQPIYLGIHEVTQAEYEKVMGQNPAHFAPTGMGKQIVAGMNTANHPVETTSWNDASEFCAKLCQREKLQPRSLQDGETITPLDGIGYRLPSEAEWEFACRAGTVTKFWIGDNDEDLTRAGWCGENSEGRTHAVGELKANPFGLFDIHGNVWEWVRDGWAPDFYGTFVEKPAINPISPDSSDSEHIVRGGRWYHSASYCRSSSRLSVAPTDRFEDLGFRVSLPIDAVKAAIASSNTIASAPVTAPAKRRFASDEWIDVIPLIDPQADKWDVPQRTGKNAWRIERGELVVGRDTFASKLVLPLDSDWPAFECELEFTRRVGDSGFNVNLPTKVGECPLLFDPTGTSGAFLGSRAKGVQLKTGAQLVTGERATIHFDIRRQQDADHVSVAFNGAAIGEWTGDRTAISYSYREGFPHDRRVSLWIHPGGNEFVFHRIRVRMLDGGTAESLRPVPETTPSAAPSAP